MNHFKSNNQPSKSPQSFEPSRPCSFCGGKGYEFVIGEFPCNTCGGVGRNTNSEFWHEPCWACNGTGKKSDTRRVPCRMCHGSGTS